MDHQALSYAFRKKDVHERFSRWLDFLPEYEFTIEYHRGISNGAADHLSRNQVNDSIFGDKGELAMHITCYDLNDL